MPRETLVLLLPERDAAPFDFQQGQSLFAVGPDSRDK